jgi:hypothetical protein
LWSKLQSPPTTEIASGLKGAREQKRELGMGSSKVKRKMNGIDTPIFTYVHAHTMYSTSTAGFSGWTDIDCRN